jgi:hypothetical protein
VQIKFGCGLDSRIYCMFKFLMTSIVILVVLHQYSKFSVSAIFYYKIKKLKLLERPVVRIQIYIYIYWHLI